MHDRSSNPAQHVGGFERVLRALMALSLISAIGAGLLIHSPARAQSTALLSTSNVTPADVVFYAEVSLDTSSAQLKKFDEILTRLGSQESLIDAIKKSATDPNSDVDLTGAEVAVALLPSALAQGASMSSDLVGAATGGSTSELEKAASSASDQGVVIIVRPTDIATLEASMEKTAGTDAKSETYKGADITTYTSSDGSESAYAVSGDYLFVATTADDLKTFIDAGQSGGKTLSDLEGFQKASDLLPAERVAFAFANGPSLFEAATSAANNMAEIQSARDMLTDFSGYTGMVVTADDPGIRFETVLVPEKGPGTAKSAGTAADLGMAERMPADTAIFASGYDLGKSAVMNGLGLFLAAAFMGVSSGTSASPAASPTPASIDDMYAELERTFGFNLKTGFLDQMSGPYGFGIWGLDSADPTQINAALVTGVGDATVLSDTLGTVSLLVQAGAQGRVNVTSKSVTGGSINHVEFNASGSNMAVDYGVVGNEFVLGVNGGAEAVMNGPSDSLAKSDLYTSTLANLPKEYQAVYFADIAQLAAAGQSSGASAIGGENAISDFLGTPTAGGSVPQAFASVTHVTDGYTFTSGILVVP
jgi:hypothetical protein